MKFIKNTSRLVEGHTYWATGDDCRPVLMRYDTGDERLGLLWGDECPPPTVEVEPERPAWVPPVCPAGQAVLDEDGDTHLVTVDRPLESYESYPPPAWPPRIGEIVEVRTQGGLWVLALVLTGAVWSTHPGKGYVTAGNGWTIWQADEGIEWRWVYRDLSDYTPPGGE